MSSRFAKALDRFLSLADRFELSDGACVFQPGETARHYIVVLAGTVRVEQTNPSGRTVVLYRLNAGDSCVLTASYLMSGKPYSGYGYAEGEVLAASLSEARYRDLLADDERFRDHVHQSFALRVDELTDVIDQLLEHRTDLRLARWLAGDRTRTITMTRQELAAELGTAREVVSRTLKTFEKQRWIELSRGKIEILALDALLAHANAIGNARSSVTQSHS